MRKRVSTIRASWLDTNSATTSADHTLLYIPRPRPRSREVASHLVPVSISAVRAPRSPAMLRQLCLVVVFLTALVAGERPAPFLDAFLRFPVPQRQARLAHSLFPCAQRHTLLHVNPAPRPCAMATPFCLVRGPDFESPD